MFTIVGDYPLGVRVCPEGIYTTIRNHISEYLPNGFHALWLAGKLSVPFGGGFFISSSVGLPRRGKCSDGVLLKGALLRFSDFLDLLCPLVDFITVNMTIASISLLVREGCLGTF